jgi:predicted aspartyl protease
LKTVLRLLSFNPWSLQKMATRIKLNVFSLDKDGYHIRLKVLINGKEADLILDTGASRTVFDKNTIHEFIPDVDLMEHDATTSGVGSNELQSFSTVIKKLQIGNLLIRRYHCAILDLTHVNMAYEMVGRPRVHGVLGGDILRKYKAKINYETKTLTLGK